MTNEPEGPQMYVVDANDPKVQAVAVGVADALMKSIGFAGTLAVGLRIVEAAMISVMHQPSPNAAGNVDAIKRMLRSLRDSVMEHEDCAKASQIGPCSTMVH